LTIREAAQPAAWIVRMLPHIKRILADGVSAGFREMADANHESISRRRTRAKVSLVSTSTLG
jgi:hypothetical protein